MVTKSNKISQVLKILLIFSLLLISLSSVFATPTEAVGSPFSQAGGWATGSAGGKDRVCEYNSIMYVMNGYNIYKYNMNSLEYIGYDTYPNTLNEIKCRGSNLYITQGNNITKIDLDSGNITDQYTFPLLSTINAFDVDNDEVRIAATDAVTYIFIMDYSTKNISVNISSGGRQHIEFSYDGEVLLADTYNTYRYFPTGYASANGNQLFQGSYSDGYSRDMAVSPVRDSFLVSRRLSTYRYYYENNFSTNSIAGIYGSPQTTEELVTGRYSVDGLMYSIFEVGGIYDYVHLYLTDGNIGLGSVKGVDYETPAWTYISENNVYLVVGTESYLRVYNTGEAGPLVSTLNAEEQEDGSVLLQYTLIDLGDIVDADCTVEYRTDPLDEWSNTGLIDYNPGDSVPTTEGVYVFSVDINDLEYRAACEYYTGNTNGTAYGQTKGIADSVVYVPEPFDIFKAILENFAIVMYLTFMAFVIIGLASNGINNIIVLLVVAIVLGFLGYMLNILNIAVAILILVAGLLIGMIYLMMGGRE